MIFILFACFFKHISLSFALSSSLHRFILFGNDVFESDVCNVLLRLFNILRLLQCLVAAFFSFSLFSRYAVIQEPLDLKKKKGDKQ